MLTPRVTETRRHGQTATGYPPPATVIDMTTVQTTCPEAAYLSKDNIVAPATVSAAAITAAEARARAELTQRTGLTVSGGSIKQGK